MYSHTKVILIEGNQYYYALTSCRYHSTSEVDLAELDPIPIPASRIWPPFPAHVHFTRAPEPLPQNCYIKRHSLMYYEDTDASTYSELSCLLLHEAQSCETLKASPHHNIAQYLGCIVENGKITGLCFVKYDMNLLERITKDTRPFDTDLLLGHIHKGIHHLHSLGLVHCDINPTNILMNADTPVITDFDSCQREGEKLGFKARTFGWTYEDFEFARFQNDEHGLSKIRDFLLQAANPLTEEAE